MSNAVIHKVQVIDKLFVEDCESVIRAMQSFGKDMPLENTMAVELLVETLSDGSEVSTIRIRREP